MVELIEYEIEVKPVYTEAKPVFAVVETDAVVWNKFRTDTQNHAKRIKDLIAIAQDNRRRIDALLGKRTRTRSDSDDTYKPLPSVKRGSINYDSDERGNRRGSRGSDDRRGSRDVDRDRSHGQSERDRSHGQSERDRSHGQSERDRSHGDRRGSNRDPTTKDNDRNRETSQQIITHSNSQGVIEVGGVSLTNNMIDVNGNPQGNRTTVVQHKMVESKAAINISSSPKLAKKPFKFGTVSLQVKLED